jgi:hypothetical protein
MIDRDAAWGLLTVFVTLLQQQKLLIPKFARNRRIHTRAEW